MNVRINKRQTNLAKAVTLDLSVEEAVALEAVLGRLPGEAARLLPWYDQIADALEAPLGTEEGANALALVGAQRISEATAKHEEVVYNAVRTTYGA